ncbi:MAG: NAD-dependent epimerase/dehydratase family protein [Treponema sp.]|nr:NAD-dependent epimerase/dehydratase family protein [Treponema sp.]MCL2272272.1 NAD-dependent epimerase/dehydratase family protein [Treponema sp.]
MKALFIGGTGTISSAISHLAPSLGWEIFHLNRGSRKSEFEGVTQIQCDIRAEDEKTIRSKIEKAFGGEKIDVVADFIAFVPDHVKKDFTIFDGLCRQYFFISSASAYQKPPSSCVITEGTPLSNPFWEYSRNKIACEEYLTQKYRESGFPVTIIRPSHTYDERSVPLGVHGKNGSWQVLKRIMDGKPVIIHGDGTSLWTITHNSDFAYAFVRLMGNIHAIGESIHITSNENLSWNQIYAIIAQTLKTELKAVHVSSEFLDAFSKGNYDFKGSLIGDKANSVIFDNSKLKRLVPEFCAKVRADEGLKMTIGNVLATPGLQRDDPEFDMFCDKVIAAVKVI